MPYPLGHGATHSTIILFISCIASYLKDFIYSLKEKICSMLFFLQGAKIIDPARTRTWNPLIRIHWAMGHTLPHIHCSVIFFYMLYFSIYLIALFTDISGRFFKFTLNKAFCILVNDHLITLFIQCLFVTSNIYFDYLTELKVPTRRVNILREQ